MTCTKSRALHAAGLLLLSLAGVATCALAAATQDPPGEYSRPRDGEDPQIAVRAAQARVASARTAAAADPQALADALTTFGDALLHAHDYTGAGAAFAEALQITEQRSGPNGTQAFKPLRGLGYSLAGSGRHEEAIPYMERALTMARAEYGVFDPEQMDLRHELSNSLTKLGRKEEAVNHMFYTLRLAEKTYGEGDLRIAPEVCALGEWFAEIYQPAAARMAYQFALNIVAQSADADELAAVEPLRGLARTEMQVVSYPEFALRARGHQGTFAVDANGHRLSGPRKLTRDGEEALKRALKILDDHGQAAPRQQLIETLIQLGDWFQIKESPREALPYYQRAWTLMTVEHSQPAPAELSFPVRVFYPMPNIVARHAGSAPADAQFVQVEFTVDADGGVSAARIVQHDTKERFASQVLSAVREARFRPRFVAGQPVATAALTLREVLSVGATAQPAAGD
jgi:TonB family protein